MKPTRKKILRIAEKQLHTKSGDKYRSWFNKNVVNIGGGKWAWCAAGLTWCTAQAGLSASEFPRTASSSAMLNKFKEKGQFKKRGTYTPQPTDIIFFRYAGATTPASHVGMVRSVSNGRVNTIEFNSGTSVDGCVGHYSYSLSTTFIVGYGHYLDDKIVKLKANANIYEHAYKDVLGKTSKVLGKAKKGAKVVYIPKSDNGKGWCKIEHGSTTGWVMTKHLKMKGLSKFKVKKLKENKKAIRIRKKKLPITVKLKINTKYKLICTIKKGKYKGYKYIGIGKKRYYVL